VVGAETFGRRSFVPCLHWEQELVAPERQREFVIVVESELLDFLKNLRPRGVRLGECVIGDDAVRRIVKFLVGH
jgi:hypothetical protein